MALPNVLYAPQINVKGVNETVNSSVSFVPRLDTGESLTGTPTVTEQVTSALTIDNVALSTATMTINNVSVASGKAVRMRVAGGVANVNYDIQCLVNTDATPAQTLEGYIRLRVE